MALTALTSDMAVLRPQVRQMLQKSDETHVGI